MKYFFYYSSPFVLIPAVLLLVEYIDNTIIPVTFPFFIIILPAFLSLIMGILSPTHNKFDYIMTIIMPLSLFCFMFIVGFFDKDDLETMFHLDRAFKAALQPACLIAYCCMALITFCASFKPIRIPNRLNRNKKC